MVIMVARKTPHDSRVSMSSHTVHGRPTLKDVKRFRNGWSANFTRDQLMSKYFWSEPSYQELCYMK